MLAQVFTIVFFKILLVNLMIHSTNIYRLSTMSQTPDKLNTAIRMEFVQLCGSAHQILSRHHLISKYQ